MSPHPVSLIPRPPDAELRHLQHSRHEEIALALGMAPEDFKDFKKRISEKIQTSLDCTRKLDEQDPSKWSSFMQWARGAMPSLAAKYEDFWPVELYVKTNLGKRIAAGRYRFRIAVEKQRQKKASSVIVPRATTSTSTDEVGTPLADHPPPYEELYPAKVGEIDFGAQVHPDAVPEDVEEFLKSCDFDLGHLTGVFVTSRAGLFNMERLELVATWPAALRRDHFERRFSAVLDDVEIEVLNNRFGGLNQVRLK